MHVYNTEPKVLERTGEARRSNLRQDLCQKTHLSHEQIEGWLMYIRTKVGVVCYGSEEGLLSGIEHTQSEIDILFVILLMLFVLFIYSRG
jgi:hypothetical protein